MPNPAKETYELTSVVPDEIELECPLLPVSNENPVQMSKTCNILCVVVSDVNSIRSMTSTCIYKRFGVIVL